MRASSSDPTTGCSPRRSPWPAAPAVPSSSTTPSIASQRPAPRSTAATCSPRPRRRCATESTCSNSATRSMPTCCSRAWSRLPQVDDSTVIAQALWTDRFGNVQLNVGPDDLPAGFADVVEVRCSAPTDPDRWDDPRRHPRHVVRRDRQRCCRARRRLQRHARARDGSTLGGRRTRHRRRRPGRDHAARPTTATPRTTVKVDLTTR